MRLPIPTLAGYLNTIRTAIDPSIHHPGFC